MIKKRKIITSVAICLLLTTGIAAFWHLSNEKPVLFLATTTSLHDSGMLSSILPDFEKTSNTEVHVIALGTGQAVEYGKRGDADVLLVHAPQLEKEFMISGYGAERKELFQNYFVLLGPKKNPAGISADDTITTAFWKIYSAKVLFVSRGDNSGTYLRELQIWQTLNISCEELRNNPWYLNGSGSMSTALILANEKEAYILSDIATWAFLRQKLGNLVKFEIQKTDELVNVYSLLITKAAFEKKREVVEKFKTWLASREILSKIENYTINSEQIFWVRW